MSQLFKDPHYPHRGSCIGIEDAELGTVRMPNVAAKFSRTPGRVRHTGAAKGEHNDEIFTGMLGLSGPRIAELREQGVI